MNNICKKLRNSFFDIGGNAYWRILFSNHSRWGFFNQFGEFSSLAKFVGGSQEVASPFGSAARYVRTCRLPHSFIRCSRGPWPSWNTKYAPTKC